MDPVTFLLIFSMVSAGWLTKVIQNGRTDRAYAAKGMVSPRYQAMLARLDKAGITPQVASPGPGAARAYFANLWADTWLDADGRRQAKRAARKPYVYDPDRPKWHERVDAFVNRKLAGLREGYNRLADQRPADRRQSDAGVDLVAGPPPGDLPPGAWTVDGGGQRVPLTPEPAAGEPDPATPEPTPDPTPTTEDGSHQGAVDAIHGTTQEEPMTAPTTTPAAAAATEVNTNEDARRNFAETARAASEAADALAAYEAAQARLVACAQGGADGMAAKAFDQGATTSQYNIADLLPATAMSAAAGAIDEIKTHADQGVRHLDKYLDSENLVASERVDPTTLAATSS